MNESVYIASHTYQLCWQYAILLVWKTWSSVLNVNHWLAKSVNNRGNPMALLLGHSWNYMTPILVPSSAKRIATQMLVTEKFKWEKRFFFWEALVVISSVPERNYLFKVSYSSTRIRYENCWGLSMKTMASLQCLHC